MQNAKHKCYKVEQNSKHTETSQTNSAKMLEKKLTIRNKCVNMLENRDSPLAHTHTHIPDGLTGDR